MNWYVVYTKSKCEKKVVASFERKGVKTFCPMNYKKVKSFGRSKTIVDPIFKSYVFLKMTEQDVSLIKHVDDVINILYWKGKPAIIEEEEIEAIKEFAFTYGKIELQKINVNLGEPLSVIDEPFYSIEGKLLALKNKTIKLFLPSLGYMMIAKIEEDNNIFGREAISLVKNSFSRS